ncbi:hypothetical protein GCM10025783_00190 [Amnibacterium soli]|uniref:Uncharacterized protein n=1 Tax=Amnibacterium soli TaxID=1282736 RepID=A0ABP8YPE2_9MICO
MSDGLPSDEQLRRIERGVQQRIRGRRLAAQRVAGALVAVLLVVGGIALVRPVLGTAGGAASSSGGSGGFVSGSAVVAVVCHGATGATVVKASEAGLPASALDACAAAGSRLSTARPRALQEEAPSPSASPAAVLCRTAEGGLHVYPGGAATCAAHAMTRVRG